jgi:hypothetical protein
VTVANHAELISFKGFGKTFVTKAGDLREATDIDLAIRQGQFVTLVGPVRLRQVDLAQRHGRPLPADQRTGALPGRAGQRLQQLHGENNKGSIEMLRQQS